MNPPNQDEMEGLIPRMTTPDVKRILLLATVSRQFHLFERVNIELLKSMGYKIHAAANYSDASPQLDALGLVRHHIPASRNPLSIRNLVAFVETRRLIRTYGINAIHCHSPVGGVIGRLAGWTCNVTPIIYTAHGFHFHKQSPRRNWVIFYPIENLLSRLTDVLITINREDFAIAQKMRARTIVKIPGVGVFPEAFNFERSQERASVRASLNLGDDALLLISVGELNRGKNHITVLRSLAAMRDERYHLLICGRGAERENLEAAAASLGVAKRVHFLGYRTDVPRLLTACDVFVHMSLREGLPVAVMEAMQAGLPCIVSRVRGNVDLIEHSLGGYVLPARESASLAEALTLLLSAETRESMGAFNSRRVSAYSSGRVADLMKEIYERVL